MRAAETIIAVLAIQVLPAAAGAQVTARQGTTAALPPQEQHFASPMILDLPFPDITKLKPGSTLRLAEVYRYICDNHVHLRGLSVAKQHKGLRRSPSLRLVISGQIVVADSTPTTAESTLASSSLASTARSRRRRCATSRQRKGVPRHSRS